MEKECKKHGLTEHYKRTDRDGYGCKKCNTESVLRSRHKKKEKAVKYKGDDCQICGYNRYIGALTFHHLDPTIKEFDFAKTGYTISWERLKKELDKCVLLCNRCHSEVEAGVVELPEKILV